MICFTILKYYKLSSGSSTQQLNTVYKSLIRLKQVQIVVREELTLSLWLVLHVFPLGEDLCCRHRHFVFLLVLAEKDQFLCKAGFGHFLLSKGNQIPVVVLGQYLDDVIDHLLSFWVIFLVAVDVGLDGVGNDKLYLGRDGLHLLTDVLLHLVLKM